MALPEWARANGTPLYSARIRLQPADFQVQENLGFEFSGDGEHDYLLIEKTGANTEWVSRQLATHAGVAAREVGYAGLKDRHAVTQQWFSVPRWHAPDWNALEVEGTRVLQLERHARKLRRGAHRSNSFRIVVSGAVPDAAALNERLSSIRADGVPNYFGEQRFGRGAGNLRLVDSWCSGARLPRHKRGLAISCARSFLFNEQLSARVRAMSWNQIQAGDTANLDGTGSVFDVAEVDAELRKRCAEMDIHPTGVLFGDGSERALVPPGYDSWLAALESGRVKSDRRSLRLRIHDFDWQIDAASVVLQLTLGRGCFATAVLREVVSTNAHVASQRA